MFPWVCSGRSHSGNCFPFSLEWGLGMLMCDHQSGEALMCGPGPGCVLDKGKRYARKRSKRAWCHIWYGFLFIKISVKKLHAYLSWTTRGYFYFSFCSSVKHSLLPYFLCRKPPQQTLTRLWTFLLPCTVQGAGKQVQISCLCWLIPHSCRKSQIFYTERISDFEIISRSSPVWELSKGKKTAGTVKRTALHMVTIYVISQK